MLNAKINKILDGLKITKTDRAELNRLIARPEVQNVLMADEQEQIKHRKSLLKELALIPRKVAEAAALVGKDAEIAVKRFGQAEAEYKAAQAELTRARLAAHYAGYRESLRENVIKYELLAGADPRIADYRFEIDNMLGRLCMKMQYWIAHTPNNWAGGGDKVMFSNSDDVAAVRTALEKSLVTLQELQLSAVTGYEITQALKDLTHTLRDPLSKLDMHPPTLDKNGKVIPPKRDGERVILEEEVA